MAHPFVIKRGTNISHWLSQSGARGEKRRKFFTQDDVKRIADWGFDHIRYPVDEEQLWDESGKPESEAFDLLDAGLDWCEAAGLKAIVDLHILRTHYFLDKQPPLFTDPKAPDHWADLWRQLSERLRNRAIDQVAYELMNEPVAEDDADWNRVYPVPFKMVRALEPDRLIIVGSNRWNQVHTYPNLLVLDDPNQMLTFHYYNPMLLTHYRANWAPNGDYEGPVTYPGLPVQEKDIAPLSAKLQEIVRKENKPYDRQQIIEDLANPLAARKKTGLPLYCGEFGVVSYAPHEPRMRWYHDIAAVFDQLDIAWGNWDYKGQFGLINGKGESTGVAEALLGIKV